MTRWFIAVKQLSWTLLMYRIYFSSHFTIRSRNQEKSKDCTLKWQSFWIVFSLWHIELCTFVTCFKFKEHWISEELPDGFSMDRLRALPSVCRCWFSIGVHDLIFEVSIARTKSFLTIIVPYARKSFITSRFNDISSYLNMKRQKCFKIIKHFALNDRFIVFVFKNLN